MRLAASFPGGWLAGGLGPHHAGRFVGCYSAGDGAATLVQYLALVINFNTMESVQIDTDVYLDLPQSARGF